MKLKPRSRITNYNPCFNEPPLLENNKISVTLDRERILKQFKLGYKKIEKIPTFALKALAKRYDIKDNNLRHAISILQRARRINNENNKAVETAMLRYL